MVQGRRSRAAQTTKPVEELELISTSEEKKTQPSSKEKLLEKEEVEDESFEFKKDETVLCYHGPLLYEGKILRVEHWDAEKLATYKKSKNRSNQKNSKDNSTNLPGVRYEIHYKGWKQRWDEWVTASRILKWTPANLALQDTLNGKPTSNEGTRKTANSAATATPKANSTPKAATPGARSSRNGTKSSTPSGLEVSPEETSPAPASSTTKRKPSDVPEVKEFKSKRLQAIHTNQAGTDSPRASTESESQIRTRSGTHLNVRDTSGEDKEPSPSYNDSGEKPTVMDSRTRTSELRNKRKSAPETSTPNNLRTVEPSRTIHIPLMELAIPETLKVYLVDQWDFITRGLQLVPLPRTPSVRTILSRFRSYYCRKIIEEAKLDSKLSPPNPITTDSKDHSGLTLDLNGAAKITDTSLSVKEFDNNSDSISPATQTQIDVIHEVLDGIALYFTKTLGTFLLYRFERPQYADLLSKYPRSRPSSESNYSIEGLGEHNRSSKSSRSLSTEGKSVVDSDQNQNESQDPDSELIDLYGAEHLIRLFVQLPQLLSRSDLDSEGLRRIQGPLSELLNYLASNQDDFFLDHYENAAPSYVNTVRLE